MAYSICCKSHHTLLNRKNHFEKLHLWQRSLPEHVSHSLPSSRTGTTRLPFLLLPPTLHLHSHSLPICHPIFLPLPSFRSLLRPRPPSLPSPMSALTSNSNPLSDSSPVTYRVVIKGRVQGVFYRDWTVQNATELGLTGWVRNRRDGSVEALFSGAPDKVQEMQQKCRRGPPAAIVTGLEAFPSDEVPGSGFERRKTV